MSKVSQALEMLKVVEDSLKQLEKLRSTSDSSDHLGLIHKLQAPSFPVTSAGTNSGDSASAHNQCYPASSVLGPSSVVIDSPIANYGASTLRLRNSDDDKLDASSDFDTPDGQIYAFTGRINKSAAGSSAWAPKLDAKGVELRSVCGISCDSSPPRKIHNTIGIDGHIMHNAWTTRTLRDANTDSAEANIPLELHAITERLNQVTVMQDEVLATLKSDLDALTLENHLLLRQNEELKEENANILGLLKSLQSEAGQLKDQILLECTKDEVDGVDPNHAEILPPVAAPKEIHDTCSTKAYSQPTVFSVAAEGVEGKGGEEMCSFNESFDETDAALRAEVAVETDSRRITPDDVRCVALQTNALSHRPGNRQFLSFGSQGGGQLVFENTAVGDKVGRKGWKSKISRMLSSRKMRRYEVSRKKL